jgi:glycosyltransferase involved in cell wall biosynthesis
VLSRCYASCDLFAFPSTTDTLGQVVLEAQASGLASIVTEAGGPHHLIREGETGLRIAAGDEAAWEIAITSLATDAARRRAMGEAATANAARHAMEPCFEAFMEEHRRAIESYSVWIPYGI